METIGNLVETPKELHIEWRIPEFDSLSDEADKFYSSPVFSFNGSSWYLKFYPNGCTMNESVGYIIFSLLRVSPGPLTSLELCLGIKTLEGKRDRERHYTCICDSQGSRYIPRSFISHYGTPLGISRSQLFERNCELLPHNVLTITCTLKNPRHMEGPSNIATAECQHCHKLFNIANIASHEKKCTSKPIKCPNCSEVILLQDWYDHECKITTTDDTNS